MEPDERDGEHFFEALAGRADRGPGTAALREALAAQARTLREAENARLDDLSEEERARLDALQERLRAAGAFRGPPPGAAPARPRGPLARLREALLGASWHRPAAIAAGVAVASALVLRLALPERDEAGAMRGAATPAITVPDPGARAARLERELGAAGARVVVARINEREWSLVVEVPDASRAAAVERMLRDAGFALSGPPPYELTVRASK